MSSHLVDSRSNFSGSSPASRLAQTVRRWEHWSWCHRPLTDTSDDRLGTLETLCDIVPSIPNLVYLWVKAAVEDRCESGAVDLPFSGKALVLNPGLSYTTAANDRLLLCQPLRRQELWSFSPLELCWFGHGGVEASAGGRRYRPHGHSYISQPSAGAAACITKLAAACLV